MAKLKTKSGDQDVKAKGAPLDAKRVAPFGNPLVGSPLKQKEEVETKQQTHTPVLCSHGIHSRTHNVGGMTVAQAREELGGILNVPQDAVCVMGGDVVKEDAIIGPDVQMLSFVKQASVKG